MLTPYEVYVGAECVGCGKCIDVCERDCFVMLEDSKVGLRADYVCVGCMKCIEGCAYNALSVKELIRRQYRGIW